MAYHFSANQFEDQYDARKLGNWEYTKWFPDRPRQRTKTTRIIANDNGHLLEGIKRENPWGNYVGTWDLPRRITRDFAEKLAAPPERLVARWQNKKETAGAGNRRGSVNRDVSETSTDQHSVDCKKCSNSAENCVCEAAASPVSSTASDEAVKCGEPVTCPKCQTAVCMCTPGKDCPCAEQ